MLMRGLRTIEPFLALRLDVVASQAVQASKEGFEAEKRKPMSEFVTMEHMTMFGRPLWQLHNRDPSRLRKFVLQKVIHGCHYDTSNVNHVFAALASRLCLDICMDGVDAIALAREAVNSHLRIVLSVNCTKNTFARMVTTTPSEPVVAEAVAELLCTKDNWRDSIMTLAMNLLGTGLVEKGLKGELFARLLCILARDVCLRRVEQMTDPWPYAEPTDPFPYAKPVSVNHFLQSLFGKKWFRTIGEFRPEKGDIRRWQDSETAMLKDVFEKGHVNFTHFTHTSVSLQYPRMPELLHLLLRQQQALQLSFTEPAFDLLIPVYFGNLDEDFDPAHVTAIVLSIKCRISASKLLLGSELSDMFAYSTNPVLCILMDLGLEKSHIDVAGVPKLPSKPYVFGIHAMGASAKTFRCLKSFDSEYACEMLLKQVIETIYDPRGVRELHDEASLENRVADYHYWTARCPEAKEWETEDEEEQQNEKQKRKSK
jgi:hypothetical protein